MLKITSRTWKNTSNDFKSVDKETKQKYILYNHALTPVEIDDQNGCYDSKIIFTDLTGLSYSTLVLYNPSKTKKENLYEHLKKCVHYQEEWKYVVENDLIDENKIIVEVR